MERMDKSSGRWKDPAFELNMTGHSLTHTTWAKGGNRCMYLHICKYIYIYAHTCIYACRDVDVHTHTYVYTDVFSCRFMLEVPYLRLSLCIYPYIYTTTSTFLIT